ncbi:hypothetical protein D3C80_1209780 [compost metagenome]
MHIAEFNFAETDQTHGHNKTQSAVHPHRREILHRVVTVLLQAKIGNGVGKRNGRHIHHGIEQHDPEHHRRLLNLGGTVQRDGAEQMAQRIQIVGLDPAIGNDARQPRHDQRRDALGAVHHTHLHPAEMQGVNHVRSQRDQPGAPNKELQKNHYLQPRFYCHHHHLIILIETMIHTTGSLHPAAGFTASHTRHT